MISPTSSFIPIDHPITRENWEKDLPKSIEWRRKELAKVRCGDPESALWLMEQIEHLEKMQEYHRKRFAA